MAASLFKWLTVGLFSIFHPFYVSVTEINHNPKDKSLEIAVKMFLDDTEKTLNKQARTAVELTAPKDPRIAQQLVSDYVRKHLILKVDGKPVTLDFVGYEVEGASIWSYFQVNNISSLKKLTVTNNILYETYESQISIIHAEFKGNKKSTRISNPEATAEFDF